MKYLAFIMFCVASIVTQAAPSKDQLMSVFIIDSDSGISSTGFACVYKDREFIATNLHALEGSNTSLSIRSQAKGKAIKLTGKLIVAQDADICLIEPSEPFKAIDVTPLEFMSNVFTESEVGDSIVCVGNDLGNGVINTTEGTIKAYGKPRIEIDCPQDKGNSGSPIIHTDSGKVVGLVTEAIVNKLTFEELGVTSRSATTPSTVKNKVSYFGH